MLEADDYDIVHVFWPAGLQQVPDIAAPITCTFHHATHGYEDFYLKTLYSNFPVRIHVFDQFAVRQLGRYGIYNTRYIPQCLDTSDWTILSAPDKMTIGYLGGAGDEEYKRFDFIDELAEELGVECVCQRTDEESGEYKSHDDILNLYERMAVYVVASYEDAGPLPAQEAFLCGRPIVSTYVGSMPQVVRPGVNGEFFYGDIASGKKACEQIFNNYEHYRRGAIATPLPSPDETAQKFLDMFQEVLDEG